MTAADDRAEIQSLIHAYAHRIDSGDVEGIVDLFEHAEIVAGEYRFSGRDTLRSLWADGLVLYDGIPRTHHLITNVDITIDAGGDTAGARSYVTVLQSTPELPLQPVAAGRHEDRFARVDGAWRFVERRDYPDLVGDLSHHFRSG